MLSRSFQCVTGLLVYTSLDLDFFAADVELSLDLAFSSELWLPPPVFFQLLMYFLSCSGVESNSVVTMVTIKDIYIIVVMRYGDQLWALHNIQFRRLRKIERFRSVSISLLNKWSKDSIIPIKHLYRAISLTTG